MSLSRWTPDFLASMRQEMDPEADDVIRRLVEEGGMEKLARMHGQLIRADGLPVDGLPSYLADYLRDTADAGDPHPEALRMAEEVLSSHGMIAFSVLACASLPECYVDRPGVPVLWETQQLNTHVHRRVVETSQFVIGVMSPGGMVREGKGVQAAQKVRLMHASIRHLILQKSDRELAAAQTGDIADIFLSHRWKEELGMPINQEDLAYTLQTFGWVTVRSLRQLGCGLTADEEEAVVHLWSTAGRLMGIRPDLLPATVDEAEALFLAIKDRVAAPSREGQSLTAAVLDYAESHVPRLVRGRYGHVPRMLTRFLVGDETADMLAVPHLTRKEKGIANRLFGVIREIEHREEADFRGSSHHRAAAEWLFRTMAGKLFGMPRGGERDLFAIPDHLADRWELVELN